MTDEEKRKSLARYRLQQAEESFDEAFLLLNQGKSLRSIVNRLYYSAEFCTRRGVPPKLGRVSSSFNNELLLPSTLSAFLVNLQQKYRSFH